MIRFIDLDNGIVFNGSRPYVFWMDHEQSVRMIYTKKICVVSEKRILNVSIPVNDVFRLLEMQRLENLVNININDFDYKNISELYSNSYTSIGVPYRSVFVHMIYIAGSSDSIGEFHENFQIDDETFEIAADFYSENEALKTNLINFGIEIPESIQSAIYDSNVHEEAKDDVILNRKYKELLLNYWNIIASRGSYRSLLDSLSWFEYGDLIKINEIWKHEEVGKERLSREPLNTIMSEKIRNTLANFSKITYIGLYLALEKYMTQNGQVVYDKLSNLQVEQEFGDVSLVSAQTDRPIPNNSPDKDHLFTIGRENITIDDYDSEDDNLGPGSNWIRNSITDYTGFLGEETPLLKNQLLKWSTEDLSLKMYLLGSFYQAYFMPIHLDLLHSTVEDLVFTNTLKCMNTTVMDRHDYVYNTETFSCNIKNGDVFRLQDVNVQGGDLLISHHENLESSTGNTPMVNTYDSEDSEDSYSTFPIFGVEDEYDQPIMLPGEQIDDEIVNNRLKTFMLNNYNGIGVVVPVTCTIPAEEGDFINSERITVTIYQQDQVKSIKEFDKNILYKEQDGQFVVNFGMLLTDEGITYITLYFSTAGGRVYVKTIHVQVLGDVVCRLKLYKVKSCASLPLNSSNYYEDIQQYVEGYTNEFRQYLRPFNDYFFTHARPTSNQLYTAPGTTKVFIPGTNINTVSDNGVKYNYVVIFDEDFFTHASLVRRFLVNQGLHLFDISRKTVYQLDESGEPIPDGQGGYLIDKTYWMMVSTGFYDPRETRGNTKMINDVIKSLKGSTSQDNYLYRSSLGFFYQHHYLEPLGLGLNSETGKYEYGVSLNNYTITDKDTLCVVPEVKYSGINLEDTEWIFTNVSLKDKKSIRFESIKEPFVGNDVKQKLEPGFYDITFRYKLGDTWNEVTLNSAFRKV